ERRRDVAADHAVAEAEVEHDLGDVAEERDDAARVNDRDLATVRGPHGDRQAGGRVRLGTRGAGRIGVGRRCSGRPAGAAATRGERDEERQRGEGAAERARAFHGVTTVRALRARRRRLEGTDSATATATTTVTTTSGMTERPPAP